MAASDDKAVDLVPTPPRGDDTPISWLREKTNIVFSKIWTTLHHLEGRNGKTTLRDSVGIKGGLSVGGTYNTSTAPTNGAVFEGSVGIGTTSPRSTLDIMSTAIGTGKAGVELLTLSREMLGSTAAPPVDFGASIGWRLRGFTERSVTLAGRILCAWDKAQTNNTTDEDAYMAFFVALDATSTEMFRITTAGPSTTVAWTLNGAFGEKETWGYTTELMTIAAAGSTDSAANLLPANSVIRGVVARVTVVIPTAVTFRLGDAATTRRFSATDTSTAATSTVVGITHMAGSVTTDAAGPTQGAAAQVRLTMNGGVPANNSGRVRVTVFYSSFTAPTS